MTDRMIDNRIKKIRELEEQAAELKDQIESLRDELKNELDKQQKDTIATKLYKIFYSCYSQNRIDTQKLKDAGLYNQFTKQVPVVSFKITDINPL